MTNKLLKEIEFKDCRALIFGDGNIMLSDYYAEHHNYLEKKEVKELIDTLKNLRVIEDD